MSYPLTLDEQRTGRLQAELLRRAKLRASGLCDYCERTPDTTHCMFPERHRRSDTFPIYLAARYSRHPELQAVAQELRDLGHDITSRWIQGGHEFTGNEPVEVRDALRSQWASEDLADLLKAACVISFTEEPGHAPGRNRGGRHVEFGVALALGIRAIVIGHRENVFHGLPQVEFFPTWADALAVLTAERGTA